MTAETPVNTAWSCVVPLGKYQRNGVELRSFQESRVGVNGSFTGYGPDSGYTGTNPNGPFEYDSRVSYAGSLYTAGALATTSYLIGRWADNPRLRETGLLGAEALANSVIVYSALKEITQRPRPREDGGRRRFFTGGQSFPSGHATNIWALATVVAHEYKDRPLWRWSAYGIATLVSVSRFTGRNHFLSDVLVGSAIGYGIGRYVYHKHHDPNLDSVNRAAPARPRSKLWPLIAPRYESHTRGFGLTLRWDLRL